MKTWLSRLAFIAYCLSPSADAAPRYWGGGSTDISSGTPPAYGGGVWNVVADNWAVDAGGTTYTTWNNAGGDVAYFEWTPADYDVAISNDIITVGGIIVTNVNAGDQIRIGRVYPTDPEIHFADGAVVDIVAPDTSYRFRVDCNLSGDLEVFFDGDVTKRGGGHLDIANCWFSKPTMAPGSTFTVEEGLVTMGGNNGCGLSGCTVYIEAGAEFYDNMERNGGGRLDFIGGLAGSGTFRSDGYGYQNPDHLYHPVQLGAGDVSSTFHGTMMDKDGSNPCHIQKVGAGTFTLAGSGIYTGTNWVSEGIFAVTGSLIGPENFVVVDGTGVVSEAGLIRVDDLNFSGAGALALEGKGLVQVLQSNYSVADARADIAAGNIKRVGAAPAAEIVDLGGTDYTQIGAPPDGSVTVVK